MSSASPKTPPRESHSLLQSSPTSSTSSTHSTPSRKLSFTPPASDDSPTFANRTVYYQSSTPGTPIAPNSPIFYTNEVARSSLGPSRSRTGSSISSASEYGDPTAVISGMQKSKSFPHLERIQRICASCGNFYTIFFCIFSCIFTILVGLYIDLEITYSEGDGWHHRVGRVWGNVLLGCLMLMALLVYVVPYYFTILCFSIKTYLVYYQYMKKFPFTRRYDWSFDEFFPFVLYLPHLWIPGFVVVAFVKVVLVNNLFPYTSVPVTLFGVLAANTITCIGLLVVPFMWWYLIADSSRWRHVLGWLSWNLYIGFAFISIFAQIYGILVALKADGFAFAEEWSWTVNLNLSLYIFLGFMFLLCVGSLAIAVVKKRYVGFVVGMMVIWMLLLAPFVSAIVVFGLIMDEVLTTPLSLVLIPVEVFHILWLLLYLVFLGVVRVLG